MNNNYFMIAVGGGLATQFFLYHFCQRHKDVRILNIMSENLQPSSTQSLGIVAKRGAKKQTPFGCKIVQGLDLMEDFIKHHDKGLATAMTLYEMLDPASKDDFQRRYGHTKTFHQEQAYQINTVKLLDYLKQLNKKYCTMIDARIITPSLHTAYSGNIQTTCGQIFYSQHLMLGLGHYAKSSPGLLKQEITTSQTSCGHYLVWQNQHYPNFENFILYWKNAVLVYNRIEKKLSLGIHQNMAMHWTPQMGNLKMYYHEIHKLDFPLPKIEEANIQGGVRLKNPKRLPLSTQKVAHGPYPLLGLYKNSLTLGFLEAYELSLRIGQKIS